MARVPPDPQALLAHADFVRALAHTLVHDAARADDIAQETWVAALEHPPRTAKSPRGWLLTILRNLARRFARAEVRRARWEGAAARPEPVPSTQEIVAREETRRRIVDAVLALEEPHRSAVILRFYEDLPPRAIARRLGLPVETVRTRIKRGLALLRGRLDREWAGNRSAWCAALAPLALKKAGIVPAVLGGVAVSTGAKVAVSAAVLIGLAVSFWPEGRSTRPEIVRPSGISQAHEGSAQPPDAALGSPGPTRSPLDSGDNRSTASEPGTKRSDALHYRGSVLAGFHLEAVAGAKVRLFVLETGEELGSVESEAGGGFDLRARLEESRTPLTLRIEAAKEGFLPWSSSRRTDRVSALPLEQANLKLILGRPWEIEGRVLEVFGDVPIPGARVIARSEEFRFGGGEPERLEALFPVATAGPDGRFRGPLPDDLPGSSLLVEADGHLPVLAHWHPQVHKAPDDLTIRLPRLEELPRLKGRVVDTEGRPIPGAAVFVESGPWGVPFVDPVLAAAGLAYWDYRKSRSKEFNKVETDAEGRYLHQLFSPGTWGVAAMHGPFLENRDVRVPDARDVECDFRLAENPVVWVGTVRSRATGLPVAGARVDVVNRGYRWHRRTATIVTEPDGGFRYGPAPRYSLGFEITAPGHGYREASFRPEPHEGEKAIVIELEPECRLRGRFVDDRGEALPNAEVNAYVWPGQSLATARADSYGVFELGGLPAALRFTLVGESAGIGYPRSRSISMELVMESPGEVRDLGAIVLRGK